MAETICAVALDAATYAIDKLYSYRVPNELREQVQIGTRVLVPFGFGNKRAEAVVLAFREDAGEFKLKPIVEVLDEQPQITDAQADAALTVDNGDIRFDHVYFKYHPTAESWNLTDIDEFYDLETDPGEKVNLICNEQQAPRIAEMRKALYEQLKAYSDPFVTRDWVTAQLLEGRKHTDRA